MADQKQVARRCRDRREYQATRRRQMVNLYFRDVEELEAYRRAAEEGGYGWNFNGWILQMLSNATSGSIYPPEYVEGLKKDLERARAWLETSRDENADYRVQVKTLQRERDVLLTLLQGLPPEGPELARRFLENATNEAAGVRP